MTLTRSRARSRDDLHQRRSSAMTTATAATKTGPTNSDTVIHESEQEHDLENAPLLSSDRHAVALQPNDEALPHWWSFPLVSWAQLPEWMRDNDFIHAHYRPELKSFATCFLSMFRIHSETGNIWTHFLGFLLFVAITVAAYTTSILQNVSDDDKLYLAAFFFGAITCLLMSSMFHTCGCHSLGVLKVTSRCDYAGIAILITGSIIPTTNYVFYCNHDMKMTYIGIVSVLGFITILITMFPAFDTPRFRVTRLIVFVSLGATGVIPVIHNGILIGFSAVWKNAALMWVTISCLCYLVGGCIYAARIPERWFPGKCDLIGQGHQIFHVCVVVAAYLTYHGLMESSHVMGTTVCL